MTSGATAAPDAAIRLGLPENLGEFSLLVGVNGLVGGMIGQERTVLPLLAEKEFGLTGGWLEDHWLYMAEWAALTVLVIHYLGDLRRGAHEKIVENG